MFKSITVWMGSLGSQGTEIVIEIYSSHQEVVHFLKLLDL